jgi:hypothetical protein
VVGNDDSFPEGVVLRSARASEHLKHILRGEFHPTTLVGVIYLSTLNNNGMGRQINTPGESRGTNEDLNGAIGKQFFNKATILPLW